MWERVVVPGGGRKAGRNVGTQKIIWKGRGGWLRRRGNGAVTPGEKEGTSEDNATIEKRH